MELTIDTSTALASVALSEEGNLRAELTWHAGRNHTVDLIACVNRLMDLKNVEMSDLAAIIVAKGPGSFNGLRVGLATAKGLAVALDIPLVAIGTFEAMALAHAAAGLPVCCIVPSGRGEIASGTFQPAKGELRRIREEHITTIDALCTETHERTIFCGEVRPEQIAELRDRLGELALLPPSSAMIRHAGCLAQLGWCRIGAGDLDAPSSVQPLYLRKPSITTPKRRKHDALSNMRARTQ